MLPYIYFLKVIICSAIFLVYYYIALRNKIYHQYNRFYLLFSFILCWFIPVLPINFSIAQESVSKPVFQAIQYISGPIELFESDIVTNVATPILTINNILLCCYLIISLIVLVLSVKAIFFLIEFNKKIQSWSF